LKTRAAGVHRGHKGHGLTADAHGGSFFGRLQRLRRGWHGWHPTANTLGFQQTKLVKNWWFNHGLTMKNGGLTMKNGGLTWFNHEKW
jgi:hypothetical protein